jgi:hypothetical protein
MNSNNDWDAQRNDQPQGKNPDELNNPEPAKTVHAREKIDIKESELGREVSQQPIAEHIDDAISQIDPGTIEMQQKDSGNESKKPLSEEDNQNADAEGMDSAGYNSSNQTDNRDDANSANDWNAENNESGRRK